MRILCPSTELWDQMPLSCVIRQPWRSCPHTLRRPRARGRHGGGCVFLPVPWSAPEAPSWSLAGSWVGGACSRLPSHCPLASLWGSQLHLSWPELLICHIPTLVAPPPQLNHVAGTLSSVLPRRSSRGSHVSGPPQDTTFSSNHCPCEKPAQGNLG